MNAYIGEPDMENFFTEITPQMCRLRDRTYSVPIQCDVRYRGGSKDHAVHTLYGRTGFVIGRLPLMLRCNR